MTINYIPPSHPGFLSLLLFVLLTHVAFFPPYTQSTGSPKQSPLKLLHVCVRLFECVYIYLYVKCSKCGHTTPEAAETVTASSRETSIHFRRGLPFFATTAICTLTSNFGYYSAIFPLLSGFFVARLEVSIFHRWMSPGNLLFIFHTFQNQRFPNHFKPCDP